MDKLHNSIIIFVYSIEMICSRINQRLMLMTKEVLAKNRLLAYLPSLPTTMARKCSTRPVGNILSQLASSGDPQFKMVYRFPYIVHARFICRFKLYQTAFILALTGANLVTQANLFTPLIVCTISLGMLAVMGEYFRRLIGIIYVDAVNDKVKISHLDFWGNRKDLIVSINDVIPIIDAGENPADFYVKVRFVDKKQSPLYITIKHGLILEKDLFHRVVGEFV